MVRIIAVSDVHLGTANSNRNEFLAFLDGLSQQKDLDYLILLGDILDYWRCNNADLIMQNEDVLDKITHLPCKVIYVVGNHDCHLLRVYEKYPDAFPFQVCKDIRLDVGGCTAFFTHGYELEVYIEREPLTVERYERFSERMCFSSNITSYVFNHLWELIEDGGLILQQLKMRFSPRRRQMDKTYHLAKSPAAYAMLGVYPGELFVFGHSHRPFITRDRRVANTGSWVNDPKHISPRWQNTYVEIKDGKMSIHKYLRLG